VSGEGWRPSEQLIFKIEFADKSNTAQSFPVPRLRVGETERLVIRSVYCSRPGQTVITFPYQIGSKQHWYSLYSYHVRTEEQIWLWTIGPLIGGAVVILGAVVQKWLGLL